jgi:hypothetical protein
VAEIGEAIDPALYCLHHSMELLFAEANPTAGWDPHTAINASYAVCFRRQKISGLARFARDQPCKWARWTFGGEVGGEPTFV